MSQQIEPVAFGRRLVATLSYVLVFGPILGCSESATEDVEQQQAVAVQSTPAALSELPGEADDGLWNYITETTSTGLTVMSEQCSSGSQFAMDSTQAAWIWSTDKTADGWGWIVDNAGDATQWASDTIGSTWTVTKDATGEFSLWVKVTTGEGIAWTKTTVPAAWKVVKDNAGEAWVWIGEHKVEVAVAAAVVAVVVAGLIVAPEAVGATVARGAVGGLSSEATGFLTRLWNERGSATNASELKKIPKSMFFSIGRSVLSQCGAQAIGSITAG